MVDTLKEFYNNSLTYSDLAGAGFSLVTTGASTTAVVKEILLRATSARALSLKVGNSKVAEARGDTVLTGTEVVPPSSTLKIKSAGAVANKFYVAASTASLETKTVKTIFPDDGSSTDGSVASVSTTITSVLSLTPEFMAFDASGNFYYSEPGATNLYKRAGGVNGAQTTIAFGQLKVYDGARYIYGLNGSTLFTYDTQTGSLMATIPFVAPNFTSTRDSLAYMDGYLFYNGAGSAAANGRIINAVTGAVTGSFLIPYNGTYKPPFGVNKDAKGNYWIVSVNTTNPYVTYISLGTSLAAPTVTQNDTGASGSLGVNGSSGTPWTNMMFRPLNAEGYLALLDSSNSKIILVDVTTGAAVSERVITGGGFSVNGYIPALDATLANAHFGTVTARAVGVEIN